MRRIIAIIDSDIKYSEKLAAYFNSHDIGNMKSIAYSDAEKARSDSRYEIAAVLSDEKNATGFSCPVVILSEDGLCESHQSAVCKYSRADKIMREILMTYARENSSRLMRVGTGGTHLYGVFSPVGRCGKTRFAITLAMLLGESSRTLMLCFDEYAGVFRHIASDASADMSDVIYAFLKGQYSWSKLAQAVYSFGTMDYVAPVRCPDDLVNVGPEQMYELIVKIMQESGYENIVIDMGTFGRSAADIFDLCEKLFMPVTSDAGSLSKVEEFLTMLNRSGRSDTAGKFERIELPEDDFHGNIKVAPDDYTFGKVREYVCELLDGRKTEEDWAERWM